MTLPTIHRNGTSREALQEGYRAAYSILGDALRVLAETAPNGRDYYPQGDAMLRQAEAEYRARATAIQHVRDDMLALFEACEEEG